MADLSADTRKRLIEHYEGVLKALVAKYHQPPGEQATAAEVASWRAMAAEERERRYLTERGAIQRELQHLLRDEPES
jgi:hypothetical protein